MSEEERPPLYHETRTREQLHIDPERFWRHVSRTDSDACWFWGGNAEGEAPDFLIGRTSDGRNRNKKAARVAWALTHGGLLPFDDEFLSAKCKQKRCVNPQHLELRQSWRITEAALAAQVKPNRAKDVQRFHEKYVVQLNGCWYWKKLSGGKAYGDFWLDRDTIGAHCASYILFNGPLPKGAIVRHKCDMPCCVNPEHLEIGSYADNASDMVKRGRSASGERNGQSIYTDYAVSMIRGLYRRQPGALLCLAKTFGGTPTAIQYVVDNAEKRSNAMSDVEMLKLTIEYTTKRSDLSRADVIEMRRLFDGGMKVGEIAKKFGLKYHRTWEICTGRARKDVARDATE